MQIDYETLKNDFLCENNNRYSPEVIKQYNYVLKSLEPFLPLDITLIDNSHIELWQMSMKERGVSNQTINTNMTQIKMVLKYGFYKGYIPKLLDFRKLKVKVPSRANQFAEDEVLWRIVEASRSEPAHHSLLLVEFENGLRPRELVTLQKSDLEYSSRTLLIKCNSRIRRIPLSNPCYLALIDYLESRIDQDEHMFISSRGTALTPKSCSAIIKKYARITANDSINITHFRHGAVRRLISKGISLEHICYIFGYMPLEPINSVLRNY